MMRPATNVLLAIRSLAILFRSRTEDVATLDIIIEYTNDRNQWKKAHELFSRIREKTLKAGEVGNEILLSQYLFEEVCVKTLYNLGKHPAPFDPDSPYWVIPNALHAGALLGFNISEILEQVQDRPASGAEG